MNWTLAGAGFAMIFAIICLLFQSRVSTALSFTFVPLVAAVLCGFGYMQIFTFVKMGVTAVMPVAALLACFIFCFSIMHASGLLDPLVNFLVKHVGHNVVLVTVATAIIAAIINLGSTWAAMQVLRYGELPGLHMDVALAITLLVTIPAMLPVYKKLHMRPVTLCVIIGAAMSVMNLCPWGSSVARVGAIMHRDVNVLWHQLIPLQIMGVLVLLAFAAFMGVCEKRRGAGPNPTGKAAELDSSAFSVAAARPGAEAENLKRPSPLTARIKAHAGAAIGVPIILLASGVFLGVLQGTKMLDNMAMSIVMMLPSFLGPVFHIVLGIFAVPIGMCLGTSPYFFGLMPLAISVGEQFGISPDNISNAMLVGKNYGVLVTPYAATTFLCIGLAGISLKELIVFCTPRLWVLSWISLFVAICLGIVTVF